MDGGMDGWIDYLLGEVPNIETHSMNHLHLNIPTSKWHLDIPLVTYL